MAYILDLPRIFDYHNHISYYLMLSACPSLSEVTSKAQALAQLRALPQEHFTVVTGWHSGRYTFTPSELHSLPPLAIINFSLHGFAASTSGAQLLKASGIEAHPRTKREAEKVMPQLLKFFGTCPGSHFSQAEINLKAQHCFTELSQAGLYGANDMLGVLPDHCLAEADPQGFIAKTYSLPEMSLTPSQKCPIKLFADGAVGAKSAALSHGTSSDWESVLTYNNEELAAQLQKLLPNCSSLAIHAIGDCAVNQVLEVYKQIKPHLGQSSPELRLEHCQFINLAQAKLAKSLGIILSMQPNFNEDSLTYRDRLSQEMCQANNPLRMVIDQAGYVPGEDLFFGSDGMPSGLVPALQNALFPPESGQKLTIEELLSGYQASSAYGTIKVSIDEEARLVKLI